MPSSDWKARQREALRARLQAALERFPAEAETWISWNRLAVDRNQARQSKSKGNSRQ